MKSTLHAEDVAGRPASRASGMARGALVGFIGEGSGVAAAIVAAALLARHLGPEGFGVFGLAAAAAAAVGWILASLFGRAALVLVPAARDPLSAAGPLLRAATAWGLIAWAGFALAGYAAAEVSGRPGLGLIFAVAGSEIPLLAVSRLHRSALTATGRYAAPGLAAGLFNAVRLAATLAVIGLDGGPVAALVALAGARAAEIAWLRQRVPIRLRRSGRALAPGDLRRLVGPFLLQAASLQVFHRIDIVLLAVLGASGGALGWYAAAQQVAVIPALVAGVVAPMASVALLGVERSPRRALLERRTDVVSSGGLVLFVAGAGVAPPLAPLLFGAAFAPAAPLFGWLALGGAGAWLLAIGSGRSAAAGDVARPAAITAAMLVLAVCAHLLAIPRFGAAGAAAVTAAAELVAGLAVHLLAPGEGRRRRVLETGGALAIGGLLAVSAGSLLVAVIEIAGPAR